MPPRALSISPWILGFSGPSLPSGLRDALGRGVACGIILFRDNLGGSVEAALELRREILAALPPGHAAGHAALPDVPTKRSSAESALERQAPRPFLFMIDEEGGLISQTSGLALPGGGVWPALPTPRALGRLGRVGPVRWSGRVLGRRLRRLGFHVDLAPCLDLDLERENPVIGSRSFGADPERVAAACRAFASGLAAAGLVSCFKHFPGHGGTRTDSHHVLPFMDPSDRELHERPFRLCLEGEWGRSAVPEPWIMSAHVDWGSGLAATLDPKAGRRLARWNPRTLRITDALDMGAVAGVADAPALATLAGNDLLLVGRDWERGL
jgi:beta-N-acetylhexosaminidase